MSEVREIRLAAGLTQAELAARSGVAQPNIAAYEAGRRRPSSAMLARLRAVARVLPHEALAAHRAEVLAIAARHGIEHVRVFGSVSRGSDTADSDLDLLISVPPGTGLMTISAFALEVEALLGEKVDVVSEGGLRADHPIRLEAVPL